MWYWIFQNRLHSFLQPGGTRARHFPIDFHPARSFTAVFTKAGGSSCYCYIHHSYQASWPTTSEYNFLTISTVIRPTAFVSVFTSFTNGGRQRSQSSRVRYADDVPVSRRRDRLLKTWNEVSYSGFSRTEFPYVQGQSSSDGCVRGSPKVPIPDRIPRLPTNVALYFRVGHLWWKNCLTGLWPPRLGKKKLTSNRWKP